MRSAMGRARGALAGLVPLGLRSLAALPRAAAQGARFMREVGGAHRALLARLPAPVRPARWLGIRIILHRTRLELNWQTWDFRWRFDEPRWLRRVHWRVPPSIQRAAASQRGIVLATAHYGALMFLGRWLCARGFAGRRIGILVDTPDWIDAKSRRAPDGRRIAARVFTTRQARSVRRFLQRGGVLIVAADFPRGRAHAARINDRDLLISTGAVRLAAHHGALLVPCIARERWWWRGEVDIGEPIAPELVAAASSHPRACDAIAEFLVRAIARDPLQCSDILLARFVQAGPGETSPDARKV